MKLILSLILTTLIFQITNAQIMDYFIPCSAYFNKTFQFETEKWENENGQFQTKNKVSYFKDPSGNYKKYIESTSYRYNLPNLTLRVHQFYYVGSNKVNDIYMYIEGVSEELKQLGYTDDNNNNKIILKYPPAQWTDKADPDVIENYKSEFGVVETKYGKYENCIIVTKSSKAITKEFKWVEKYVYKVFYAYKIGLVKTETYENGKLMKMEAGYGGTLIDDFSEYSFSLKEKEEKELFEIERKKIEEEKKISDFLKERKNTIYNYKELNQSNYNKIGNDIKEKVKTIIEAAKIEKITFNIEAHYSIDTLLQSLQNINIIGLENSIIKTELNNYLKSITLQPTYLNKYKVNTQAEYEISFSQTNDEFYFKKNQSEFTLKRGDKDVFGQSKSYLNNELSSHPNGKYKLKINQFVINNEKKETIQYLKYKNFGGASSAFLSVVIPGAGDYLVNGGNGSMLGNANPIITTIGVYGLIGTGYYFKNKSIKNYDLYHKSTDQSNIDKYYNLANSQNKAAWTIIGISGVVWLADIYWVIKKGSKNKKVEKETRNKLNIAFVPSFNNSFSIGITYKL